MTTPEGLIQTAEAAAAAWRLEKTELVTVQEQLQKAATRAAGLEDQIAREREQRDQVATELAAVRQQVTGLEARVAELLRRLAEYEKPEEPEPVLQWQPLSLLTFTQAPAEGTLVTVGAVLPKSLGAGQVIVTQGEQHVPVPRQQVDVLRAWDNGARFALVTVPFNTGEYLLGPAAAMAPGSFQPQLPRDVAVQIALLNGEARVNTLPTDPGAYEVRVHGGVLWEGRHVVRLAPSGPGDALDIVTDLRVYVTGEWNAVIKVENTRHDRSLTVSYSIQVTAGGSEVYRRDRIDHHHHACYPIHVDPWRALAVCGEPDLDLWRQIYIMLPHANAKPSKAAIDSLFADWQRKNMPNPMSSGLYTEDMPKGGGRMDIGPFPTWTLQALLSGDPRAYRVMFDCAARSGAYPIHYRDKDGSIYSVVRHPTASLRIPSKLVADFVATGGTSPTTADNAHQPDFVTVPYLLSGHRWMLDESVFFAEWGPLVDNPGRDYRDGSKALLRANKEARSQAWRARNNFNAWRILPDSEKALEAVFRERLKVNGDWYRDNAVPQNSIGSWGWQTRDLAEKYAAWPEVASHTRMWQVDYFTMVTGWMVLWGLPEWEPMAKWLAAGAVARVRDLPPEQATAYGLAGQDRAGRWFEPWAEAGKRSPDGKSDWHCDWTRHYQIQVAAALAIATLLGIEGARPLHEKWAALTVGAFPQKFADDPTFVIVPGEA